MVLFVNPALPRIASADLSSLLLALHSRAWAVSVGIRRIYILAEWRGCRVFVFSTDEMVPLEGGGTGQIADAMV